MPSSALESIITINAVIAGYLNRKQGPPPGYQKILESYIQLTKMIQGANIFAAAMHDGEVRLYGEIAPGVNL